MKHVRNQHTVPEFLLKNFSSNNNSHIWSFDKNAIDERWRNEKNRAISSAPTEDFFYDRVKGVAEGSFEYILRENETKVAPIISKLIETRSIKTLLPEEICDIATFVSFQMFRTRGKLLDTIDLSNQINDKFEEAFGYREDINTRELWFANLEKIDLYTETILNKTWVIAESDERFFISDNPVVLQNTVNQSEVRGTLGLNSPGIEIYLPVSSSVTLCFFCKQVIPYEVNNIKCEPEHIVNMNWLQIINSTRFVFSKYNKFDLIYELIEEGKI